MKQIKRLTTLALAVMLLLSLAIPAFAADDGATEDTPKMINISVVTSASGAGVAGHTYKVYQIFTGDVAADGVTLSNVAFGKNYAPTDAEGKAMSIDAALAELKEKTGAEAAEFLKDKTIGEAFGTLNDDNNHTITAPTGYYLIIDVSEGLPETEEKSAYILQALEDVKIMSKHDSAPKTYKKIDDKNDSTGAEDAIVWHDSADHDIGDLIDFQLNAVIPSSIEGFREYNAKQTDTTKKVAYRFVFHDKEEDGLEYQNITEVYVLNGTTKTAIAADYYDVVTEGLTDGCTFEVVFADLTEIEEVQSGSTLVVEYQSELTEDAVLGNQGNVNEMCGEYRNLNTPETPSYTPWDHVIAFTYKVVVNKVDENEEPLAGAEFTLEKYDAETETWKAISKVETESETVFTFEGLDDGNYRLTETKTPDGYNTIEPIEFTVTAEHDITWETEDRTDLLTYLTGTETTGEITFTSDKAEGSLTTDVENKSGTVLPETGGMGTTIFYALGGMMVLVAVVLLVTKKRMASAE